MLPTTTQRTRRTPTQAGQAQLVRRLQTPTARNAPFEPVGREADPRNKLRKAARYLWESYTRNQTKKDRCVVLLRDASTHAAMLELAEQIAQLDQALRSLDDELDVIETKLNALKSTTSAREVVHES